MLTRNIEMQRRVGFGEISGISWYSWWVVEGKGLRGATHRLWKCICGSKGWSDCAWYQLHTKIKCTVCHQHRNQQKQEVSFKFRVLLLTTVILSIELPRQAYEWEFRNQSTGLKSGWSVSFGQPLRSAAYSSPCLPSSPALWRLSEPALGWFHSLAHEKNPARQKQLSGFLLGCIEPTTQESEEWGKREGCWHVGRTPEGSRDTGHPLSSLWLSHRLHFHPKKQFLNLSPAKAQHQLFALCTGHLHNKECDSQSAASPPCSLP